MSNVSAAKALGGIALVVVPLVASSYFARPTFANAIQSKMDQEAVEAKRNHQYSMDGYAANAKTDKILKKYQETGPGTARSSN